MRNELDLIEVALCIAKVSDARAIEWLEMDAALWTVVVKPWILVQCEQ